MFHRGLEKIRHDFDPKTWQAFWRVTVDGLSATEAANELSMKSGTVRVAKSRVLQRLRRQLGDVEYVRTRDREFSDKGMAAGEVAARIDSLLDLIPGIVASLNAEKLDATYPENVLGAPISTRQFVVHLHSHLNYHLGQIDYLRRVLTDAGSLPYPRL